MSEESKKQYETSGVLTEAILLKEFNLRAGRMGKHAKVWMLVLLLVFAVTAVARLLIPGFAPEDDHALYQGLFVLLLFAVVCFVAEKNKKLIAARFREAAPEGKLAYTSWFSDEKLYLQNHTSGGFGEIALNQFKRLVQVEDVWLLYSKGEMIYPVFPVNLSKTDRESVLALLKEKNPKVKFNLSKV